MAINGKLMAINGIKLPLIATRWPFMASPFLLLNKTDPHDLMGPLCAIQIRQIRHLPLSLATLERIQGVRWEIC